MLRKCVCVWGNHDVTERARNPQWCQIVFVIFYVIAMKRVFWGGVRLLLSENPIIHRGSHILYNACAHTHTHIHNTHTQHAHICTHKTQTMLYKRIHILYTYSRYKLRYTHMERRHRCQDWRKLTSACAVLFSQTGRYCKPNTYILILLHYIHTKPYTHSLKFNSCLRDNFNTHMQIRTLLFLGTRS